MLPDDYRNNLVNTFITTQSYHFRAFKPLNPNAVTQLAAG